MNRQLDDVRANMQALAAVIHGTGEEYRDANREMKIFGDASRATLSSLATEARENAKHADQDVIASIERDYQRYNELYSVWAKAFNGANNTNDNLE